MRPERAAVSTRLKWPETDRPGIAGPPPGSSGSDGYRHSPGAPRALRDDDRYAGRHNPPARSRAPGCPSAAPGAGRQALRRSSESSPSPAWRQARSSRPPPRRPRAGARRSRSRPAPSWQELAIVLRHLPGRLGRDGPVDAGQMRQQMALEQQAPRLDPGRIEQPVGGEEAPARIGQRPRQGRGPGQQAAPLGAQQLLEFGRKLAQASTSLPKMAPSRIARSTRPCPIDPCATSSRAWSARASWCASQSRSPPSGDDRDPDPADRRRRPGGDFRKADQGRRHA